MRLAGPGRFGRCAARLAIRGTQPFHGRAPLARLHPQGFVAPSASLPTQGVTRGQHVYIGDGVVILRHLRGREIQIDDHVCIYGDTLIQTGREAGVVIGAHTHIQPGCHFSAFVADIRIGSHVEVAPDCAFFSYNHGIAAGTLVRDQPLRSSGPVIIGDGAWLGYGCVVLAGVEIGAGAIVGARSVVTRSIPANAVAVGSPARVLRYRA